MSTSDISNHPLCPSQLPLWLHLQSRFLYQIVSTKQLPVVVPHPLNILQFVNFCSKEHFRELLLRRRERMTAFCSLSSRISRNQVGTTHLYVLKVGQRFYTKPTFEGPTPPVVPGVQGGVHQLDDQPNHTCQQVNPRFLDKTHTSLNISAFLWIFMNYTLLSLTVSAFLFAEGTVYFVHYIWWLSSNSCLIGSVAISNHHSLSFERSIDHFPKHSKHSNALWYWILVFVCHLVDPGARKRWKD